ncbi:hypothetical protein [Thermodesulfovibrio sp. TK110]
MLSSLLIALIINLGTYGATYPIEEPDMMAQIEQAQALVSYEDIYKAIKNSYRADIYLPDVKTKTKRKMSFTYTVPEDLIIDGKLIAQKGQTIDVLQNIKLKSRYLFLKDYQMPLLKKLYAKHKDIAAVIVQGDLLELQKKYPNYRLYIANQALIEKFQITGVPTLIYQEGNQIIIEEIPFITGQ